MRSEQGKEHQKTYSKISNYRSIEVSPSRVVGHLYIESFNQEQNQMICIQILVVSQKPRQDHSHEK